MTHRVDVNRCRCSGGRQIFLFRSRSSDSAVLQDAYNLGWKLAAVVRGASPELLNTYSCERREVAEEIARQTRSVLEAFIRPSKCRNNRNSRVINGNSSRFAYCSHCISLFDRRIGFCAWRNGLFHKFFFKSRLPD